jgi:hypothetical protein
MRSQHIYNDRSAKPGEIIDAYDRVFVSGQNVVQPGLELHDVLDTRTILQRPCHMGNRATEPEPLSCALFQLRLDKGEHRMLIEVTMPKVSIVPVMQPEPPVPFCDGHIDAGRRQSTEVFVPKLRIDDVDSAVAAFETILDERQQHPVFLVGVAKEGADMTCCAEL